MTSLKQIEANRLNAQKSTGPRTDEGKQRSRQNALRHGLTAETVITSLENAADYQVFEATLYAEYQPRTTTSRASWQACLRTVAATTLNQFETGLLQIQGELMQGRNTHRLPRNNCPLPEWYDEMDVAPTRASDASDPQPCGDNGLYNVVADPQEFAYCFLQGSRLQFGAFETLSRYETALWRQAAQLIFILQSTTRR